MSDRTLTSLFIGFLVWLGLCVWFLCLVASGSRRTYRKEGE